MPSDDRPDRDSFIVEEDEIVTDPDEIARIEAENGILQFDAVTEKIQEALSSDAPFRLRPSTIMELNRLAIQRLHHSAGSFRSGQVGIRGSRHQPPHSSEVPAFVDELCDYVNDNWGKSALHLAAYLLWRINWVHPFVNGNGRTARALSYLVMNVRLGWLLPGTNTIPAQIAANKAPYYRALELADAPYEDDSSIDVTALEDYLDGLLASQLTAVHAAASDNGPSN